MSLVLVTGPASEPVTLAELRAHCRVDGTDEDTLLAIYLAAARRRIEEETGRALLPQTWRQRLTIWPGSDPIPLGRTPLRSIASVAYTDSAGDAQTLAADTGYRLDADGEPPRLWPVDGEAWPAVTEGPAAFTVVFSAGYADAASVPEPLKQAVLLLAGHAFSNREAVVTGTIATELPLSVAWLLDPFRVERYV